ncbi:alpha/beta hydrolase [Sciscionella sediminilitoris]|uniref:alpha/beta hydrolase n=1 Tax=Sciscionella sediminilitoris TaxID=1445613 RepID=UPI0004DF3EFD|nr:alpha/beta hydrolase [Sciscionella sp. SE31]
MVSISDIRKWNADQLEQARSEVQRELQILTSEGDDFAGAKISEGDWTGKSSASAMAVHDKLVQQGDRHAAGLAAIVKGLAQASDAVRPLPRQINEAEEFGRKYGFEVGENGEVTDTFAGKPLPPDMHPEDREGAKQEITAKLEQVVRTATDIDADLAGVFGKAGAGQYGVGQTGNLTTAAAAGTAAMALTTPDPPAGGTATQNAAWWGTLSKAEQGAVIGATPDKIGNLNGLPAAARSKANMNRIPAMRARLLQQLKNSGSVDEIKNIEAKLKSLDKIKETMHRGNRSLLVLDDTHPRMEAAIGIGDIDGAKNVNVFAPGFTTTVDGSLEGYDANMADLVQKENSINQAVGDDSTNAAVTWIGYQAPQVDEIASSQSVALPQAAQHGGDKLAGFLNGVGAAHETNNAPLHLTALGHSYGSTTTGEALGHNTPVNDSVLFGSPGEGWNKPHVNGGHIYSEEAATDYVPAAGRTSDLFQLPTGHGGPLGPDTYSDPNIQHLSTNIKGSPTGGDPLAPAFGHSEYLHDGTTSQYNIAAVGSGHPDLAMPDTQADRAIRDGSYFIPGLAFGTP